MDDHTFDMVTLEEKLAKLERGYGHFLRHEKSLAGVRERLLQQVSEQVHYDKVKKHCPVLVVETHKFYKICTQKSNTFCNVDGIGT